MGGYLVPLITLTLNLHLGLLWGSMGFSEQVNFCKPVLLTFFWGPTMGLLVQQIQKQDSGMQQKRW